MSVVIKAPRKYNHPQPGYPLEPLSQATPKSMAAPVPKTTVTNARMAGKSRLIIFVDRDGSWITDELDHVSLQLNEEVQTITRLDKKKRQVRAVDGKYSYKD